MNSIRRWTIFNRQFIGSTTSARKSFMLIRPFRALNCFGLLELNVWRKPVASVSSAKRLLTLHIPLNRVRPIEITGIIINTQTIQNIGQHRLRRAPAINRLARVPIGRRVRPTERLAVSGHMLRAHALIACSAPDIAVNAQVLLALLIELADRLAHLVARNQVGALLRYARARPDYL